jgi:hypothetical protein
MGMPIGTDGDDGTETIELCTDRSMDEEAEIVESRSTTESRSDSMPVPCCSSSSNACDAVDDADPDDIHRDRGHDNDDDNVHIDYRYATTAKQPMVGSDVTPTYHESVDEIHHSITNTIKRRNSNVSSSTTSAHDRMEHEARNPLAISETRKIQLWKIMVLVTIIVVATVVSTGTFLFLDRQEEDDYKHRVRPDHWCFAFCP